MPKEYYCPYCHVKLLLPNPTVKFWDCPKCKRCFWIWQPPNIINKEEWCVWDTNKKTWVEIENHSVFVFR